MDAVTPAGLPQGPSPFEEDKLIYATTGTASSGPWRWIPPGIVVACKVSASFPGLPCSSFASSHPTSSTPRRRLQFGGDNCSLLFANAYLFFSLVHNGIVHD